MFTKVNTAVKTKDKTVTSMKGTMDPEGVRLLTYSTICVW